MAIADRSDTEEKPKRHRSGTESDFEGDTEEKKLIPKRFRKPISEAKPKRNRSENEVGPRSDTEATPKRDRSDTEADTEAI